VVLSGQKLPGYRFPLAVIGYAVWLYHRFSLSYRDVEELLLERGIAVTRESIRTWCIKFSDLFAQGLRHREPRGGSRWYLDEMYGLTPQERTRRQGTSPPSARRLTAPKEPVCPDAPTAVSSSSTL
jgi:hypothetical protein